MKMLTPGNGLRLPVALAQIKQKNFHLFKFDKLFMF